MAILKTFDLKGNKLSFANWISNLSPAETPFTSMISKEAVDQTMYSWQVDRLASPKNEKFQEGSDFIPGLLAPTQVQRNFTQILRKVVRITDTANKIGLYGRASEKAYQMEKAGKEIRRDLELCVLQQTDAKPGAATGASKIRQFAGFPGLVAAEGLPCGDTGAVVHKTHNYDSGNQDPAFTKEVIFEMTYNLYLAGSKANKVMVHPIHMILFSGWINGGGGATRLFDGLEEKYNMYVGKFRDPLGQEFTIIPNRFMPMSKVYFFNESDWTQMILRAPEARELARNGSSEKHMIEMEVGLRHRNPYASGILNLKDKPDADVTHAVGYYMSGGAQTTVASVDHAVKLHVDFYKNGAIDTSVTGQAMTILVKSGQGGGDMTQPGTMTITDGKFSGDVTFKKSGVWILECADTALTKTTVEILVHSPDRKLPQPPVTTLEEKLVDAVIEAPVAEVKAVKARKPKA